MNPGIRAAPAGCSSATNHGAASPIHRTGFERGVSAMPGSSTCGTGVHDHRAPRSAAPSSPDPSGPIDVVAIRHAPTAWNAAGRIQGHTDVPLGGAGRRALAGRRLPERFGSYRAHSSPLARAVETAALLGLEAPVLDRRLMEMDWGEWEGRTRASVAATDPGGVARNEARGPDFRPPGGESPREVQARIVDWAWSVAAGPPPGAARNRPGPAGGVARSAARSSPHVVAITHKGVVKALLGLACGWDLTGKSPVRLDWTRAHRFRFDPATGAFTLAEPNIRLERDG